MSSSPKPETANELLAYGYTNVDGVYVKEGKDAWSWDAEQGGWLCFRQDVSSPRPWDGGGTPGTVWGAKPEGCPEGWHQVPFQPLPKWQTVSGLTPGDHPECWLWAWPDEHVWQMLHVANRPHLDWHRAEDGTLVGDPRPEE